MQSALSQQQWTELATNGYVRVPGAFNAALPELDATMSGLLARYPYGFDMPPMFSGRQPTPRARRLRDAPHPIIIPNFGFLAPVLMKPLANPFLYELIERVIGKGFCLNNTWFQMVQPGTTDRLAYHKDARGSITLNILLDDIGPKMGSTCVIPGTHLNTPPPWFCMDDIHKGDRREVDMTGSAGDLVLFSNETWHARAENTSDKPTRRLFYNLCSRSSRSVTAWSGVVTQEQMEAARAMLPPEYRHMIMIDADLTRDLQTVGGPRLRRWSLGSSSSTVVLRDVAYQWTIYGRKADHERHPGYLLPYTTRLVEHTSFSPGRYLSHFKPLPTFKNIAGPIRRKAYAAVGLAPKAKAAVMAE